VSAFLVYIYILISFLCQGNHQFLGNKSSSSFHDTQEPFHIIYGSASVTGTIVTDNLVLAGLNLNGLKFGAASQETELFAAVDNPFDGLMGLAPSVGPAVF
jgi:hypothetical protein